MRDVTLQSHGNWSLVIGFWPLAILSGCIVRGQEQVLYRCFLVSWHPPTLSVFSLAPKPPLPWGPHRPGRRQHRPHCMAAAGRAPERTWRHVPGGPDDIPRAERCCGQEAGLPQVLCLDKKD
ncbi:hypothetical protein NDU88_005735 [Pleurodeles waltl]|uniref:Uncharacterized protein n=1 Tax=Pleurodeles waltl TaxID=8319 RepID=A0AAV7LM21_PLEWA|nr:hypothetical protein NDU88_005735 [Pleurodeles waltl]